MEFYHDRFDFNDIRRHETLTPQHIMDVWQELAADELPWCAMPHDDRHGIMRPTIAALLDLSEGLFATARRQRIGVAAALHGSFRRAQGCANRVIADDFMLVRAALKLALVRRNVSESAARQFVRCLLPDWRFARRAAAESFLSGPFWSPRASDSSPD
ncbi:MAG TPA: hypothetical protein VGM50_20945 [Gemmatimonadaceae bacterium]|jgi:hypothetical protein